MKWFAVFVTLIAWCGLSHPAAAQEDQYLNIYTLIQQGDDFRSSGRDIDALGRYAEAQSTLQRFQKTFPDWNNNVVKYRLDYLASAIAELSAKSPAAAAALAHSQTNGATVSQTNSPAASESDTELKQLQAQVRQLQMDKTVLEAKLKEALSAQPAATDPRELARAEEQIKSLQKENELLEVNLARQPAPTSPPVANTKSLEDLKSQLAEANRKLTDQADQAKALALEREALQKKLDSLIPAPGNTTNVDATRQALDDAGRKLAEQTGLASRLALEKTALQMRIKTLTTDAEAVKALRSENEILKKQLAELKLVPDTLTSDADQKLAAAQAQIAALQSDKELLLKEKAALENRVQQGGGKATPAAPPDSASDAARVKQLEAERDDLLKRLEAAQKEPRSTRKAAAQIQDLTDQLDVLRTRLGVLDAQKIPYTPEELALFSKPAPQVADTAAGKKSIHELPAGTSMLVAEAQNDFAARRYDQAEQKYLQVLQRDDKNVPTLANLAAIQLEMDHFSEAETNLNKALAIDPKDAYSLSILGCLKFRQGKYDDALDVLGRGAKLDPQNAVIQNYLGLTLVQKGMREAGESALRKAIELDPGYRDAHYNLAVVYATQKPPSIELARWHYQKALAAGYPPNAEIEKLLEQVKP